MWDSSNSVVTCLRKYTIAIYLCEEKNKKAEKDFNMGIINEEKRHEITETTRILINTINRKIKNKKEII